MNAVAQLSAGLSALLLIAVFPLEAFLIERPWVQRFLGIEPNGLEHVRLWSFCIGARNALAGLITLTGLWFVNYGDLAAGTVVTIDGGSGEVALGEAPILTGPAGDHLGRLLGWADEVSGRSGGTDVQRLAAAHAVLRPGD